MLSTPNALSPFILLFELGLTCQALIFSARTNLGS